jgi:hypothetical protein
MGHDLLWARQGSTDFKPPLAEAGMMRHAYSARTLHRLTSNLIRYAQKGGGECSPRQWPDNTCSLDEQQFKTSLPQYLFPRNRTRLRPWIHSNNTPRVGRHAILRIILAYLVMVEQLNREVRTRTSSAEVLPLTTSMPTCSGISNEYEYSPWSTASGPRKTFRAPPSEPADSHCGRNLCYEYRATSPSTPAAFTSRHVCPAAER